MYAYPHPVCLSASCMLIGCTDSLMWTEFTNMDFKSFPSNCLKYVRIMQSCQIWTVYGNYHEHTKMHATSKFSAAVNKLMYWHLKTTKLNLWYTAIDIEPLPNCYYCTAPDFHSIKIL